MLENLDWDPRVTTSKQHHSTSPIGRRRGGSYGTGSHVATAARRHVATAGIGITVGAESIPTEHKGGEKNRRAEANNNSSREQILLKRDITVNSKRDMVGGRGQRTTATYRRRRYTCACLGTHTRYTETRCFSPSTGKPSGAASTSGQQCFFCTSKIAAIVCMA